MTHEDFMREALLLAQAAADEGEVPVGAVVVKNGATMASWLIDAVNGNSYDVGMDLLK